MLCNVKAFTKKLSLMDEFFIHITDEAKKLQLELLGFPRWQRLLHKYLGEYELTWSETPEQIFQKPEY